MRLLTPLQMPYHRWRQRKLSVRPWSDLAALPELRGASIALVGNAGYLAEIPQGKQIDGHDIVIRMNNFRLEGYEAAVGTKTDIFLTNFYHDIDFSNPPARQAQWIVSSVPNNFREHRRAGMVNPHGPHITRGLTALGRQQAFVPDLASFQRWIAQIGKYPTTGAVGLLLLTEELLARASRVYLTGFSFFQGPSHYFTRSQTNAANHDPEQERRVTAAWMADPIRSGQVTLDPHMHERWFSASPLSGQDAA